MEQYESNSDKSKTMVEKEPEIRGTVQGEKRKTSKAKRFFADLVNSDATNVGSYIMVDVIAPAIRRCISDAVKGGVDMIFGTDDRSRRNSPSYSYDRSWDRDYRPYNRMSEPTKQSSGLYAYDDILFTSRYDVEQLRNDMLDVIKRYRTISVAQMCDIARVPSAYTDHKYGWNREEDIYEAGVGQTRDGRYFLRLPRPTVL